MTKTINITQTILDSLTAGEHTLTVTATTDSGFSTSSSNDFLLVANPMILVDASQGSHAENFTFNIKLVGVNENATVYGYIDGKRFYQLNYGMDGIYTIKITDNMLYPIAGGEHEISFSLTDKRSRTARALTTFTKVYTLPIVSVSSNLGDRKGAFSVPFTIMNAVSEHPALAAYVDTTFTPIFVTDDASHINSVTVDAEMFDSLDIGAHSVILVVTNEAGSTTKTSSFNKITSDSSMSGLKLGYLDDTWDSEITENRLYEETEVVYAGQTYKSFEDKTPYDTEGEVVTGGFLASVSRGVQNASSANTVRSDDGTYTETSANGTSILNKTGLGYIETYSDRAGNTLVKRVQFNPDGTVTESTTFTRAAL